MSLGKSFKSFLGKHSDELSLVGNLLSGIIATLPIESKEKARIVNAATSLKRSANNIKKSIKDIDEGTTSIKFADVERAVAAQLPSAISAAVAIAVAAALSERDKAAETAGTTSKPDKE